MLIAEVSQRKVIATASAVCYIFVCCFKGLFEKVCATVQCVGKQAIKLSELALWDVETVLYPKDENKVIGDKKDLVMNIYNLNNAIAKPLTISL